VVLRGGGVLVGRAREGARAREALVEHDKREAKRDEDALSLQVHAKICNVYVYRLAGPKDTSTDVGQWLDNSDRTRLRSDEMY
jgi:hypothetical protein